MSPRSRMIRGPGGMWRVRLRARCATRAGAGKKDREAEARIYTRRNYAAASRVTLCNLSTESRRDVISSCQGRGCACSSVDLFSRSRADSFLSCFRRISSGLRLQPPDQRKAKARYKVNIYRRSGNIYQIRSLLWKYRVDNERCLKKKTCPSLSGNV